MKKAFYIEAFGRVQGVGFRYYSKLKANELGLCGYVKNLINGNVELKILGNSEQVLEMLNWLEKGPETAFVDKLEYHEIPIFESEEFHIDR